MNIARVGVLHGTKSYVMQTADGQIRETHSISAGLDYPSVGPEHALLRDQERAFYTYATDEEALAAFQTLCQTEGHHPGAGIEPRRGRGHQTSTQNAAGPNHSGEPERPWRQRFEYGERAANRQ
jgi:hypothetical protein